TPVAHVRAEGADHEGLLQCGRLRDARARRPWRHEHHARGRPGADARDWRAQGARRHHAPGAAAVLPRGVPAHGHQRRGRVLAGGPALCGSEHDADAAALPGHGDHLGSQRDGDWRPRPDWRCHLYVSGTTSGATAARRGAEVRGMKDILRESIVGLVRNRTRAALSMLGISWGIVSVVMLLAYGEGFNQALLRGFQGAFGDGVTVVFPGQTSMQAGGERAGRGVRLRLADAEAVGELPLVKAWSPEYMTGAQVSWGAQMADYGIRGVAPSYASMRSQVA